MAFAPRLEILRHQIMGYPVLSHFSAKWAVVCLELALAQEKQDQHPRTVVNGI